MRNKETKKYEINYNDLIKRKFKEHRSNCSLFEEQYGFEDFSLELKLTKKLVLTWNPLERLVKLHRKKNKNFYATTALIKSLSEIDFLIKFFKSESKDTLRMPIVYNVGSAC